MGQQFFNKPAPKEKPFVPVQGPLLQRKCACGNSADISGECDECREKKNKKLQTKSTGSGKAQESVSPKVNEVLSSPGQSLDDNTRASMETKFGHDFSKVKIHTDEKAADSAKAVNARAYTVGEHIAFDMGNYSPGTKEGKKLLSHELTHVRQQQGGSMLQLASNEEGPVMAQDAALEQEALNMEQEKGNETDDSGYTDEPGLEGDMPNPGEEELAALLDEADMVEPGPVIAQNDPATDPTLLSSPGEAGGKAGAKPVKKIVIDLGKQTATATENGKAVKTMKISSGKTHHETHPGKFKIYERDKDHKSSTYGKCVSGKSKRDVSGGAGSCKKGEKYEGAPMKYFQRFNGGEGLHKGMLPGHPDSHGCVRLEESNAAWLWDWAEVGTEVNVVAPAKKAPAKKATPKKKK